MAITMTAGSDFSANVGLGVYKSDAGTIALWTDPTVQPFGVVLYVDEATPTKVVVARPGDDCKVKVAAGGIDGTVDALTTVGAGAKFTAADVGEFYIALNNYIGDAAENDLIDAICAFGQLSVEAAE